MEFLRTLFKKYSAFFIGVAGAAGIWGIFVIAFVDSLIPVVSPDVFLAGFVYKDRPNFWLYALLAAVGSTLGCIVWYWIGYASGELVLLKRVDRRKLEKMRQRYEKQEFWFTFVPCLMPPGFPLKIFLLAAGAFEMRFPLFLLAIFSGRLLRFLLVAFLVMFFGPQVVHLVAAIIAEHRQATLITVVLLLGILALIGIRKWMKAKNGEEASHPASNRPGHINLR